MKKANNYIFDVDGTLTPSRGHMDPQFAKEFLDFAKTAWGQAPKTKKTYLKKGRFSIHSFIQNYNCI